MNKERRKNERFYTSVPVRYRLLTNRRYRAVMGCGNLSGSGMNIIVTHMLKPRDRVEMVLNAGDKHKQIKTLCEVIWCRKEDTNRFKAGLEFFNTRQDERFMSFICEKLLDFY